MFCEGKRASRFVSLLGGGALSACCWAQSVSPAVFVANNGNLEGSVTSFTFDPAGVPQFVGKLVTGSKPNSQSFHPGTNAYSISLTPDGRYLATGHTTSSETVEQVTILRVNPDATLSAFATFTTPDSPLGMTWLTNDVLAITRTNVAGGNQVYVYRFDESVPSLTQIDVEATGTFNTAVVLHPSGKWLYAQDSTGKAIRVFEVAPDGTLTLLQTASSVPSYPLGPGISPNGAWLYAGGGISNTGKDIVAMAIDAGGLLAPILGSPFLSPGSSPKQVVVSADNQYAFVAHGTDATCRSFAIDPGSGALTATGFSFDVGLQGSLGSVAVLGPLLLVTDNFDGPTGLYSFTINPDGSFTQNGSLVSSQGVAPTFMAVWNPPACKGDIDGDGKVTQADLGILLASFGLCAGQPGFNAAADLDKNGCVDQADLGVLLAFYGCGA